jgi:predicted transposase YbfD/YdcC
LKGNQGLLRDDVELLVNEQKAKDFADTVISRAETIDADNGRIETRVTTVIHDVDWLRERHDWPGLNAVAIVESTREQDGVIEHETRYFITSLVMPAILPGPVIRSHWAIENSLHWMFRDDECRVRTNHAPANFTTIKHMAHIKHMAQNLLRRPSGKDSFRVRRKVAGWDDDNLASLITT